VSLVFAPLPPAAVMASPRWALLFPGTHEVSGNTQNVSAEAVWAARQHTSPTKPVATVLTSPVPPLARLPGGLPDGRVARRICPVNLSDRCWLRLAPFRRGHFRSEPGEC